MFTGSDGTGTAFFECLNDACGGNGCAEGYTGIFLSIFHAEELQWTHARVNMMSMNVNYRETYNLNYLTKTYPEDKK